MNKKKRNARTSHILMKANYIFDRRIMSKPSQKYIVNTPEEARELGIRMAQESAKKLSLNLKV